MLNGSGYSTTPNTHELEKGNQNCTNFMNILHLVTILDDKKFIIEAVVV
jgi:hypothetical protein